MTTNIDVPKTVSQLPSLTSPTANTKVIVNHTANSVTNTYTLTIGNLLASITGPYANDTVAANNSIDVNHMYYDSNGHVRIRLT